MLIRAGIVRIAGMWSKRSVRTSQIRLRPRRFGTILRQTTSFLHTAEQRFPVIGEFQRNSCRELEVAVAEQKPENERRECD